LWILHGFLNRVLDIVSADSVPASRIIPQSTLVYPLQVRISDKLSELADRGIPVRPGLAASENQDWQAINAPYVLDPILRTKTGACANLRVAENPRMVGALR
jgi:hypothetical protein